MEDILVPIAVFGSMVLVVWTVMHYKAKVKAQNAGIITAMINKGDNVTPEVIRSIGFMPKRRHGDLRTGLILAAIGLAFMVMGQVIPEDEAPQIMTGIASFPLLIGLAITAFWYFVSRKDQD